MAGQLSSFFYDVTARSTIFAVCAAGVAFISTAFAETTPSPATPAPPIATPAPVATPDEHSQKLPKLSKAMESPAFDNVRKALDALTPAQRKRFQENLIKWQNLSPDEKKALRDREEFRKKVVTQEVDTVIKDSGLELDPERREQFAKRYSEERRKIEEQLRKEAAEKRKPLLKEMVGRLKEEFANPATAPLPATAQPSQ